jgi:hypothetical protein
MLSLATPLHNVLGVSVFSDHADPQQFYYLPIRPHLSTVRDQTAGTDVPLIGLLQFTGDKGGGFLNFTVDLGIGEELLSDVKAEVKRIFRVEGQPRLVPVPLEDGSVRLIMLGKSTPEPAEPGTTPVPAEPAPATGLPEFVLKIDHPAKPALFGDNAAIFSVSLDEAGTTLVKNAFDGVLMPVGIVYSLQFLGLRPAFNVRVHADWDRVQEHFQEQAQARLFFLSTEIDTMVDKLVEDKVILIEVDNFVPEGEDETDLITDPDKVLDEVKEMVFSTFFEPSINPVSAEADGWEKAVDVANKVSTLAVTGGWAGIASASYKKIDLERVDKKAFDFNLRERTTVRRRIHPQAHLEGLTRMLRDAGSPLTPEDFIKIVPLDDPFFRHRTVTVTNRADMAADDIASIAVSLRYGDERRSVTLDQPGESVDVSWEAIVVDGAVVGDVVASYEVTFGSVDSADRPARLSSGDIDVLDGTLDISPRADGLYHVVEVPVTALKFPFDRYPHVQVDLRYADPEHGIELEDTLLLDDKAQTKRWKWFLRDRAKDAFEYRVTYRAADNRDFATDWRSSTDEQVLLRDPRPSRRTVSVVPAVSWELVSRIFVDLTYRDPVNGVFEEQSLHFSRTDDQPKSFSVALEDPEQRVVSYQVRLLLTDNSLVDLPESTTMRNQVVVRADMKGHRVVPVRLAPADLGARKVREVRATLRYQDETSALDFMTDLSFTSADELAFFEYDFVDTSKRAYALESMTIFTNGFTSRKPRKVLDTDAVVVPVG